MAPCGVDEGVVNVDTCDGAGGKVLGNGGGYVTIVCADVEDYAAPEDGVWEAIEAEV